MNKTIFNPLVLLAMLFIGIGAASCQNTKQNDSAIVAKGGAVAADEFEKLIAQTTNAKLVDVRTPDEYTGGHIANAININVNDNDFKQKIAGLDKTKPVFVYCLAGSRSADAADYMRSQGFVTVYELKGGVLKWQAAGKSLETGSAIPKKQSMTQEEFLKKVTTENYVLVDYNAVWCKPCLQMAPMLDKVAADKKDKLTLLKVDADENKELLQQKGINEVPVLELYHKGKLVWSHKGLIDEAALLSGTKL